MHTHTHTYLHAHTHIHTHARAQDDTKMDVAPQTEANDGSQQLVGQKECQDAEQQQQQQQREEETKAERIEDGARPAEQRGECAQQQRLADQAVVEVRAAKEELQVCVSVCCVYAK